MFSLDEVRNELFFSFWRIFFFNLFYRGNNHSSRANPYQMPVFAGKSGKSGKDASMGRFIDDDTEIDFIMSRIEQPLNIPNNKAAEDNTLGGGAESEKGIPDLPDSKSDSFKPVLLMLDKDADYQVLDLGLKISLDRELKMIGIWLPETVSVGKFLKFLQL